MTGKCEARGVAFSITEIPFSYFGSWLDLSPVVAENRIADDLHLVSHQTGMNAVLSFTPTLDGRRAPTEVTASPAELIWAHPSGRITAAFENADTLRVRGTGLALRILAALPALTPFSGSYFLRDPLDGALMFTNYESGRRYRITVLAGEAAVIGDQALGSAERGAIVHADTGGFWEIAVEEFQASRPPYRPELDYDAVVNAAAQHFSAFVDDIASWRSERTPAATLAAYVLWSATVEPAGFLGRHTVLMSKHWMNKVWSWDHCFNALALAAGRPDLATDQFRVVFDHQDPSGALPDSITHSEVLYNFVKPPIHGWALHGIRRRLHHDLDLDDLVQVYRQLSSWTSFWLTMRRVPGHTLAYYQHGNDSGWDNSTTFDDQRVVETADLAAFLSLQMMELSDLAHEIGQPAEATEWDQRAREMQAAMITELWDGNRFAARDPITGELHHSDSLLNLMPLILGGHLPADISVGLINQLHNHITTWGLATEPPESPQYQSDGYWRGPIWAPSTVLLEDGLRRGGHPDLADEINAKFRALCEHSGFAENFDALTGTGLRDRAYTWTASAYLMLAADFETRAGGSRA